MISRTARTTVHRIAETDFRYAYVCMFLDSKFILHCMIFYQIGTTFHRFADTDCWCPSSCMFYDPRFHSNEFSGGTTVHRRAEIAIYYS